MSDFQVALLILGTTTVVGIVVAIVRAVRRHSHLHDAPRRIMMLQHENEFEKARKLTEDLIEEGLRRGAWEPEDLASNLSSLGWTCARLGDNQAAIEHHRKALDLVSAERGEKHPESAKQMVRLGQVLVRVEKHDEAEPLLLEAVGIIEEHEGPRAAVLFSCHRELGVIAEARGDHARAIEANEKALGLIDLAAEDAPYWRTHITLDLADQCLMIHEPEKALDWVALARASVEAAEDPTLRIRLGLLQGQALEWLLRLEEAKEVLLSTWALIDDGDEEAATWRFNIGQTLGRLGHNSLDFDLGRRFCREALDAAGEGEQWSAARLAALTLLARIERYAGNQGEYEALVTRIEGLVEAELSEDSWARMTVVLQSATSMSDKGQVAEAAQLLDEHLARQAALEPEIIDARIQLMELLTALRATTGRIERAIEVAEEVLALIEQQPGARSIDILRGRIGLLNVRSVLVNPRQALEEIESALEAEGELTIEQSQYLMDGLLTVGHLQIRMGEFEQARQTLERIEQIADHKQPLPGSEQTSLNALRSHLLWAQGDYEAAAKLSVQIVTFDEQTYGRLHLYTANSLIGHAWDLLHLGDLAHSRELVLRAREAISATLGPEDHLLWRTADALGCIDRREEHFEAAKSNFERALELFLRERDGQCEEAADIRIGLGRTLRALGDLSAAREQLTEALAVLEAFLGPDHHMVGLASGHLAALMAEAGEAEGAASLAVRCRAVLETTLGPAHPKTRRLLAELVRLGVP